MNRFSIVFVLLNTVLLFQSCSKEQIEPADLYTQSLQAPGFDLNSLTIDSEPLLALQIEGEVFLFRDGENTIDFVTRRDGPVSASPGSEAFINSYEARFRYRPKGAAGKTTFFSIFSHELRYIGSFPRIPLFVDHFNPTDSLLIYNSSYIISSDDNDSIEAIKDSIQLSTVNLVWNRDVKMDQEYDASIANYNPVGKSYFRITDMQHPDTDAYKVKVRCEFEATMPNINNTFDTLRIEKGVFVGYFENPFDRLK